MSAFRQHIAGGAFGSTYQCWDNPPLGSFSRLMAKGARSHQSLHCLNIVRAVDHSPAQLACPANRDQTLGCCGERRLDVIELIQIAAPLKAAGSVDKGAEVALGDRP